MFSLSFAAARPSLRLVYHNLPAGARGKPPPSHSTARPGNHVLIRATRPGKHRLRSPGTAPSAGPPVTRPTTICRSARHIAFRPFFTCRTQHRCFGVEPPPIVNIYLRLRAAHRFSFVFHAPQAAPSFRSLLSAVPRGVHRGAFACAAGLLHVPWGRAPRGLARVSRGFRVCRGGVRRGGVRRGVFPRVPRGFRVCSGGFCTCRGGVRRGVFPRVPRCTEKAKRSPIFRAPRGRNRVYRSER